MQMQCRIFWYILQIPLNRRACCTGAPLEDKYSTEIKYRMKMRHGCWFTDKFGKRVEQKMHRDKWESDDKKCAYKGDSKRCRRFSFQRGGRNCTRNGEDEFIAVDKVRMPFRCNKARRRKLQLTSETVCTPGVRCCMHNTLRCRQDFCEQKCKLEGVCESVGVRFHLLLICHPELNPIEGAILLVYLLLHPPLC
jgi:hypothetical protein